MTYGEYQVQVKPAYFRGDNNTVYYGVSAANGKAAIQATKQSIDSQYIRTSTASMNALAVEFSLSSEQRKKMRKKSNRPLSQMFTYSACSICNH